MKRAPPLFITTYFAGAAQGCLSFAPRRPLSDFSTIFPAGPSPESFRSSKARAQMYSARSRSSLTINAARTTFRLQVYFGQKVHAFAALPVFGIAMALRKPGRLAPVVAGQPRKEVNHV
jgi:hypothetical protein